MKDLYVWTLLQINNSNRFQILGYWCRWFMDILMFIGHEALAYSWIFYEIPIKINVGPKLFSVFFTEWLYSGMCISVHQFHQSNLCWIDGIFFPFIHDIAKWSSKVRLYKSAELCNITDQYMDDSTSDKNVHRSPRQEAVRLIFERCL